MNGIDIDLTLVHTKIQNGPNKYFEILYLWKILSLFLTNEKKVS